MLPSTSAGQRPTLSGTGPGAARKTLPGVGRSEATPQNASYATDATPTSAAHSGALDPERLPAAEPQPITLQVAFQLEQQYGVEEAREYIRGHGFDPAQWGFPLPDPHEDAQQRVSR